MLDHSKSPDDRTAQAFAYSWNTLPAGSVYSEAQVQEWLLPLTKEDFSGKRIVELGCGNASLLVHVSQWNPSTIHGVDLGAAVDSAQKNLLTSARCSWVVEQADMLTWIGEPGDIVFCIGVLHHLNDPFAGFKAVLRATRPGGQFHCWVYGWEGNAIVRLIVEPLRRVGSILPRWITKFLIALPLSVPFFIYAKFIASTGLSILPLGRYMQWISKERFRFFWHVAFDQLVTPRTIYIGRWVIQSWFEKVIAEVETDSIYIIHRHGNSWKFGGTKRRQ